MDRITRGQQGERLAVNYLETHGYLILDRNVRLRRGEIDIVARKQGVLVFVEVKTRTSNRFGCPAEAVTPAKARHLIQAAREYLHSGRAGAKEPDIRFDVVSILLPPDGEAVIELFENAFDIAGAE